MYIHTDRSYYNLISFECNSRRLTPVVIAIRQPIAFLLLLNRSKIFRPRMLSATIRTITRYSSTTQKSAKMVVRHHVEGYENFQKFMEAFPKDDIVYVLFSGSKLPNGSSWCPDCVEAEPSIQKGLEAAPESSHFIYVEVGDRSFWKDLKCPFRTDSKTNLKVLPTLARWGTQKRLEGDQCLDVELVEMLVTDEDE